MRSLPSFQSVASLAALVLLVTACEEPVSPASLSLTPNFWVGCVAGEKFTGGGRADTDRAGKVTFGFNVHGEGCDGGTIKGQFQADFHETSTKIHSTEIWSMASFSDPERGDCAEFDGMARIKDGNGPWTDHRFWVIVCDNGEPGDTDRISIYLDDSDYGNPPAPGSHSYLTDELLTGGNIQSHS